TIQFISFSFWSFVFFTFILGVLSIVGCARQSSNSDLEIPSYRRIPNMWVDKASSNHLEGNFNLQHFQLSQYFKIKETDSIFYPIKSFCDMIDYFDKLGIYKYLHVYIASYDKLPFVPPSFEDKLTLLFCPAQDSTDNIKTYYSITPSGLFDPASDSCKINHARWITKYADNEVKNVLLGNLDLSDNHNHSQSGTYSDTRRISYDYSDIKYLMDEVKYQKDSNGVAVSGIKAIFSSYSSSGQLQKGIFVNRIFVLFEFTTKTKDNNQDSVFYIDDQPHFSQRLPPLKTNSPKILSTDQINQAKGNDNGHLCPPNCP
ncbi:MAG TPA: hypothetical protein VNX68_03615, partial [Nitrosopumilaceae archaeon]|nr:hypothetical protein [Nitrosopumilaceae archaeon]